MILNKTLLYLALPFLLIACSSNSPTQFYLLKAINPEKITVNRAQSKSLTVLVNPIKFPEYLDRPQMVVRDNAYKLKLSEKHRWAEPLSNEFSRVLIKNLSNRITPNHVVEYYELKGAQPDIHLSIKVLRLDVGSDDQAVLSVKWAYWTEKNAEKIIRLTSEYNIPIKDSNYESRIEAQSQAIALFTDYIAETIGSALRNSSYEQNSLSNQAEFP